MSKVSAVLFLEFTIQAVHHEQHSTSGFQLLALSLRKITSFYIGGSCTQGILLKWGETKPILETIQILRARVLYAL